MSELLQAAGLLLTGILLPLFMMFRRESREAAAALRGELDKVWAEVRSLDRAVVGLVATIKERDRIGRMLEERLPR